MSTLYETLVCKRNKLLERTNVIRETIHDMEDELSKFTKTDLKNKQVNDRVTLLNLRRKWALECMFEHTMDIVKYDMLVSEVIRSGHNEKEYEELYIMQKQL